LGDRVDRFHFVLVAAGLLSLLFTYGCEKSGDGNIVVDTFAQLEEVRDREKEAIENHFEGLKKSADIIVKDELMLEFFYRMEAFSASEAAAKTLTPSEVQTLDSHFVHNYGSFYDVLFVEPAGYVFHSIKQESDHHSNLFTGSLSATSLSKKLQVNPQTMFVDFETYGPSGEAASFFVKEVIDGGKSKGWFVLQYGSNELNAMLTNQEGMGRTGEVYLVNKDRLMLSDSRFVNSSSILQMAVNTEPVRLAFETGAGNLLSRDYRGVEVFSSFDSLQFLDISWTILMEIDADEIRSNYYLNHQSQFAPQISLKAATDCKNLLNQESRPFQLHSEYRVDINEMRRIEKGEVCWTAGVGPCTALIAYLPQDFGYMLHIGPTDDAYNEDSLTRVFLGTRRTDLVNTLLQRITRFDIVENNLSRLKFIVVASHSNSIYGTLNLLLKGGVTLSQIKFAHNPDSDYANVLYDQANVEVRVNWVSLDNGGSIRSLSANGLQELSGLLDILGND